MTNKFLLPTILALLLCSPEAQDAAKLQELYATSKAVIREITGGPSDERLQLFAEDLRTDTLLLMERAKDARGVGFDLDTLALYAKAVHGLHDYLLLRSYEEMAQQSKASAHMISKKFRGDLIGLVQVPDLSKQPTPSKWISAKTVAQFREVAERMASIISTYELEVEKHVIRNSDGKDEPRQFIAPKQSEKILARTRELLVKANARVDGPSDAAAVAAVPPPSSPGAIESIVSNPAVQSDVKILYFTTERRDGDGATRINGELKNVGTTATGVQLQAIVRDGSGRIIDSAEFWPASIGNIPAGASWPIAFTVSSKPGAAKVELRIIGVKVW